MTNKNYKIISFEINKKIDSFDLNIEGRHGIFPVPFYEVYLYAQEYSDNLFEYMLKFNEDYRSMMIDLTDLGYDFKPLLENYINDIIKYRLERVY